jgi:hypothetical protein
MKKLCLLAVLLAAGVANGQDNPSTDRDINTRLTPRESASRWKAVKTEKPNEIRGKHVVYSGVIVQFMKTDRPLQLLNPAAPPEYSEGVDNIARDLVTKKASGFKLFSFSF